MARNVGKYLEDMIQKELKRLSGARLKFRRLYDSASARNYLPANPSDFFGCILAPRPVCFHLEAKSQKGKTPRLKKFTQLAEMKDWTRVGIAGYVVVHFYELDKVYVVNVNDLEFGKPSWLLHEGCEAPSVEEAVRRILSLEV